MGNAGKNCSESYWLGSGYCKTGNDYFLFTEAVVKEIIASKILPEGALQLICGSAGDLLDHVTSQDVITFTGTASTGLMLKSNPRIF